MWGQDDDRWLVHRLFHPRYLGLQCFEQRSKQFHKSSRMLSDSRSYLKRNSNDRR